MLSLQEWCNRERVPSVRGSVLDARATAVSMTWYLAHEADAAKTDILRVNGQINNHLFVHKMWEQGTHCSWPQFPHL